LRGKNSVDPKPAVVADQIAMGMGQFTDNTVSAKEPELAADGCGAAPGLLFGCCRFGVEQRLQIAVAEAVDGELAAANGPQQFRIAGFERVQRPHRAAIPSHPLFQGPKPCPTSQGIFCGQY